MLIDIINFHIFLYFYLNKELDMFVDSLKKNHVYFYNVFV